MPAIKNEFSSSRRPKRVTLQDIAKIAGVHVMTVSDALNGTRSVAPATKEKVRQIAQELNYIPNFAARALVTGQTGVIAILCGAMNEPYYANMVHQLEKHITEDGFKLMLMRTAHEVKDLVNATGNTAVDGAIAVDMSGLVNEFQSHPQVPCVSIGTEGASFVDHVIIDLSAGVEKALDLMFADGRQRVAYVVTAGLMAQVTEVRAHTYLTAMRRLSKTPEIINADTDVLVKVRARIKAYIEENGCPDALLCQNDETAMCVYRALRDLGYRVPEDALLVGCDGQLHMEYFDPPLSTIMQPMEEMCALAWQFLKQRIAHPDSPIQQATLHGTLVVRQSLLSTSIS